ncbi:MAG: GNAT family N-acetyltransferase [Bacteriovoracaceae bacterium]|nr:GNAT family N-acetyltransferase [Bacteriovoracaceae bacterium]
MTFHTYEYARLDAFPEFIDQTNSLIEEAFSYQKNFKFNVDFAPLTNTKNARNRHLLIDKSKHKVIAHVGARHKNFVWQGEVIPVTLLGGIAVDSEYRGQGLFQILFEKVLAQLQSQCAFFLLWSDKHELYNKWDFYLAGKQWCYRSLKPSTQIQSTLYKDISKDQKEKMAVHYRQFVNQNYFSPLRDDTDWEEFNEITSSDLLLTPEGYAFKNKGMDLQGILHDFAHSNGVTGLLHELGNEGVLWSAKNEIVEDDILQDLQLVGLWKPNTHSMALKKLSHLLGFELHFRDNMFVVDKDDQTLKMNAEDLLNEIFNYGNFGLRKDNVPVYIGGLDSI